MAKCLSVPFLFVFGIALATALGFHGSEVALFSSAIGLLAAWSFLLFARQSRNIIRFPIVLSLLAFLCWQGITLIWSPAPGMSTFHWWWWCSLPLAAIALAAARDRDPAWTSAAAVILTTAAICSITALYQFLVLDSAPAAFFFNKNNHAAFLNIALILSVGLFVSHSVPGFVRWIVPGLIVLTATVVFVINSRGAFLGLGVGLVAAWTIGRTVLDRRRTGYAIALIAVGALMANALQPAAMSTLERLGTMGDPGYAGHSRFVIWTATWDMILQRPLSGWGLGLFWLAYPTYRSIQDSSAGYFVHNDYLQIWVEGGLPALLLFAAVGVVTAWRVLAAIRTTPQARGEVAAIVGALAAVSVHSTFTFNLFVLPILIVMGALLGRLESLATDSRSEPARSFHHLHSSLAGAALIAIATYLVPIALASLSHEKARELTLQKDLAGASIALQTAQRLAPSWDHFDRAQGDLYRQALSSVPAEKQGVLFEAALNAYKRAQRKNPLRAAPWYGLGRLLADNPEINRGRTNGSAEGAFKAALSRNPLDAPSRLHLSALLQNGGREKEAREVLLEGAEHHFPPTIDSLRYYLAAEKAARSAGYLDKAATIEGKAHALRTRLEKRGILRPTQDENEH